MTKHKYRNQRERKPQKEIVYLHEKKKQKISTIHEPDLVAVEELNTVSPAVVSPRERLITIIVTFTVLGLIVAAPITYIVIQKGLEIAITLAYVAGGIILMLGLLLLPIFIEKIGSPKPVKKKKFKAINYSK